MQKTIVKDNILLVRIVMSSSSLMTGLSGQRNYSDHHGIDLAVSISNSAKASLIRTQSAYERNFIYLFTKGMATQTIPKLSLVAQYDDICRYSSVLTKGCEKEFKFLLKTNLV
ncbi:hypothetical protein CEXT_680791 [Caerostris extrusa]|uniref:Uncharacterized protein n=1 Tax=Caerostris extrusa TaxID=172846 RepID=A0AAV4X605_CAEEX|nr:hypothetical protein CEXT_680791 [Caerostris extrusa]